MTYLDSVRRAVQNMEGLTAALDVIADQNEQMTLPEALERIRELEAAVSKLENELIEMGEWLDGCSCGLDK